MGYLRFLPLVLCLCFCAQPLGAQQWRRALRQAERAARKYRAQEDAARAVQQSVRRAEAVRAALQTRRQEPGLLDEEYPAAPNLRYQEPWMYGWALRSNRELTAEEIRREYMLRRLERNQEAVLQTMRTGAEPSGAGLADLVPADARYIFLGEYHGIEPVHKLVADLIIAYQQKHPEKEVLVLMEMARDMFPEYSWFVADFGEDVAARLSRAGLRVAGLEEIQKNWLLMGRGPEEKGHAVTVFTPGTLPGMRARNAHWTQAIRAWRRERPDAVLFIYGGGGHMGYDSYFAPSLSVPEKEAFVYSFLPASVPVSFARKVELFHRVTKGKYYKPGLLLMDRRYARMAGFDAQVIVDD